jgi:hypothetical protein
MPCSSRSWTSPASTGRISLYLVLRRPRSVRRGGTTEAGYVGSGLRRLVSLGVIAEIYSCANFVTSLPRQDGHGEQRAGNARHTGTKRAPVAGTARIARNHHGHSLDRTRQPQQPQRPHRAGQPRRPPTPAAAPASRDTAMIRSALPAARKAAHPRREDRGSGGPRRITASPPHNPRQSPEIYSCAVIRPAVSRDLLRVTAMFRLMYGRGDRPPRPA